MGHELEILESGQASMFSGEGHVPWHRLGTVVEGCLTAEEAIAAAGLNWTVDKVALYPEDCGTGEIIQSPVPRAYGVMRDRDKKVLGVVGENYTPLQNLEAFGFLDELVSRKEAMFVSAGALHGGACIWLLVKLPGDILIEGRKREDVVSKYLLLTNRHDGWGSACIKFTPIRVVCWNTLSQALRGGALTIRHTRSITDRVSKAYETLGLSSEFYSSFRERASLMATRAMNEAQVRAYLHRCLKLKSGADESSDAAAAFGRDDDAKSPRALDKCLELYEVGKGAEWAKGSIWNAFNALTEFADHHVGYRTPEARLKNVAIEGNGNALKVRAWTEACRLLRS